MSDVYRKRTRSNVIVRSEEFTRGRIVWVAENGGSRVERVCTGNGTEVVTQAEFRQRREKQAEENRARYGGFPSWRCTHQRDRNHHSLAW